MPADRNYLVKVERRVVDTFKVQARSSMEAYAKVYGALAEDEQGDGVVVRNVSHEIVRQEVKQPRVENGDDVTLPGLG